MMNNNFFRRHTKRMATALVASACALSLTTLPASAADENTTQDHSTTQRCIDQAQTAPSSYLWTANVLKTGKRWGMSLFKIKMNPNFKGGVVQDSFQDQLTPFTYGDIAVLPNYDAVYGIEFLSTKLAEKFATRLTKHNNETGDVEWTKTIVGSAANGTGDFSANGKTGKKSGRPYGTSVGGMNGLSFGPKGETLLAGSYLNSNVYEILPEDPQATDKTVPIVKLDATFPDGLVSGGDFIILPDGSLLGLGILVIKDADGNDVTKGAYLVKWDADENGSWNGVGKKLGQVPVAYGMARVGGHILLPSIKTEEGTTVYDVNVNGVPDENGMLPYTEFTVPPRASDVDKKMTVYGASSSGDGGLSIDEGYLTVKTVFSNDEKQSDVSSTYLSGRKHKDDQVTLSSEDYCAGGQFAASAGTSGSNAGLQQDPTGVDIAHTEFVVKGTWHTVSEDFANATLAQELGKASVNRLPFYDVALTCEAIHPDGTSEQLTTGPISVTATRASADVQVSNISGARTVCTFTNTPLERPRAFPLTGATTNGWQLLGAVGVLAAFAVFPVVSVVRKRKVQ